MKKITYMGKIYPSFKEGCMSLRRVSGSAAQSMCASMDCETHRRNIPCEKVGQNGCPLCSDPKDDRYGRSLLEKAVLSSLVQNMFYSAPGNRPSVRVGGGGVGYETSGGLIFGWAEDEDGYTFYVSHPDGVFPEGSSLLKSALDEGWEDISQEVQYLPGNLERRRK